MIDSLEYYHNRDNNGNLQTQESPQPIDDPFEDLMQGDINDEPDDEEITEDDDVYGDPDYDSGRTDEELEEN